MGRMSTVRFKTNIPLELTFPFGDFLEVTSPRFGNVQYLYTVEENRQKRKLYASENLHDQLQAAEGFGRNSVVEILKYESDQGNYSEWAVTVKRPGSAPPARRGPPAAASGPAGTRAGNSSNEPRQGAQGPARGTGNRGAPPAGEQVRLDNGYSHALRRFAEMFEECYLQAQGVLTRRGVEDQESTRILATTLFIESRRSGYWEVDETPVLRELRQLAGRVVGDERYAEVQETFGLQSLPVDPQERATLLKALQSAVETVDELTPPPAAPKPPAAQQPPRASPGEVERGSEFPPEPPAGQLEGLTTGQRVRLEILAKEAFGAHDSPEVAEFMSDLLGRTVTGIDGAAPSEMSMLVQALKRAAGG